MDTIKHQSLFNNEIFRGTVGVVGVGALGSAVAIQLAKLGITSMVLWDADKVEGHNLPNQILYGPEDIGKFKATAASDTIQRLTGYEPAVDADMITHQPCHLLDKEQVREWEVTHLFVCVDSMEVRKQIFERCVFLNPQITFYCEGRMNAREGTLHAFDPTDTVKCGKYMSPTYLYPDDDVPADRGTCGNVLSLGATAMMLACNMVWAFIEAHKEVKPALDYNELSFSASNLSVYHKGMI